MTPVSNPQEAIERMLQEKKLSSKINYDVLKNLGKDLVILVILNARGSERLYSFNKQIGNQFASNFT